MRSNELYPRGQHTVGANSEGVKLIKLARLTLMSATFLFGPSVHAGDCLRDGVPAFQVRAPNGAVSVLIGSVHSAFEGLCLPSSRIMKGKKRYVVEGIHHPSLREEETSAPAALLLEKQRLELSSVFELLPRQAWSTALTDSQIVELRRRAECLGYQPAVVELALRLPSAALASEFALRPCARSGVLTGDEQLARAAAAEGLWAFALETQPEADLQRGQVLDGRNRVIIAPTAFDINTSIQRALVKAIALHGLGLYIYAGEDLPQVGTEPAANDEPKNAGGAPTKPTDLSAPVRPLRPPQRPAAERPDHSITLTQQRAITRLAAEVGVELPRVLEYFGVTELGEIPAADFLRVMRSLEKHRSAA